MPTVAVNINLSSIGTDAGPFTISDNVSGVLATGIPRTSLLANYVVEADDTATQIIVTSTGLCTTTIIIPIDFHPCGDTPPPPPPTPPTPPPPPPSDCKQNIVINVTDTGYIKYFNCTTEETEYQFISGTGNTTLTNCIDLPTIAPGIPLADVASFTIVNNGTVCSSPPTPTPTPTPPTPTPTPPPPSCILVIEEVIAPEPQVGANNFFGAKVTLDPWPVAENVTVNGYLRDDDDIENIYNFSLVITAGDESAETANNVLMTGPASTASIFITSITPTTVTYDGDLVQICGYESDYVVEVRMNGMTDRNGSLTLYQSPDDSTWTEMTVLTTTGSEVAIEEFIGTPGYYYYYTVTKTSGSFAYANAYNTVLATDFSPGPIEGVYCAGDTVTFPSFQLPFPYQAKSYVSFNGSLDSGCL